MTDDATPDPLLAVLVDSINASTGPDARATITLTIDGLVIAGDIVPAWVWFREMQALLAAGDGESSESFASYFGVLGDEVLGDLLIREATGEETGAESASEEGRSLPTTVHLARTEILGLNHAPTEVPGGLWRAQLARVSGWSFGRIDTAG
jgi:hypothetical protein